MFAKRDSEIVWNTEKIATLIIKDIVTTKANAMRIGINQ